MNFLNYDLHEIETVKLAPLQWVVEEVLPEGLTFLYGKPKARKSWFAFGIALAMAGGTDFIGQRVRQGNVLYIALEDNIRRMQFRAREMLKDKPFPKGIKIWHDSPELPRLGKGLEQRIEQYLIDCDDCGLVILDTFGKARGAVSTAGKNAYNVDVDDVGRIHRLAKTGRVAILVVHHQSKAEREDVFDTASGTLGITGTADTLAVFSRDWGTDRQKLVMTGRDLEDVEVDMTFSDGVWARLTEDVKKERKKPSIGDLILQYADEHEGKIIPSEFSRERGLQLSSVIARCSELAREEKLLRQEPGYVLPDWIRQSLRVGRV